MATVADILHYIETEIAPRSLKMDWDNVGLNLGRRDREVKTVLVALDPFFHVCEEAKAVGADLLVSHHALIWQPGFITDADAQGRSALFLIENGIAHINAHTNLDCAPGGVNDALASALNLQDITTVPGDTEHLLRMGHTGEQFLESFLSTVKANLRCDGLRYVSAGKPVRKVAVGGGSCSGAMAEVAAAGCDTFVTADVKYNGFWDAKDLGLNLIDAGHFHTENPVVAVLAEKIAAAFPEVTVKISENHWDCMKFY